MLILAGEILVSLILASLIGFVCAWLLRRHAVQAARAECHETRLRLLKLTAELHAFQQQHQNSTHPLRLDDCETELRVLESELESILSTLIETRQDIGHT